MRLRKVGLVLLLFAGCAAKAQSLPMRVTSAGRAYEVRVQAVPGDDIAHKLQAAIDRARQSYGGTVVLPPGKFTVSRSIELAGSLEKFPTGGASGVALEGAGGTVIKYTGPAGSAVLDMPAPWGCAVRNLTIDGNGAAVAGVRYRGGYDRQTNGGKNNQFENLEIRNVDVGIEIGDVFNPDLVGSTFTAIHIEDVRIGVRLLGANVTGMVFSNVTLSNYRQAGFSLLGFGGRRIRRTKADPPASSGNGVLTDPDSGREIFADQVPPYTLEHMASRLPDGQYVVGGGSNDLVIFGLEALSQSAASWLIDTNQCHVRIYSARLHGPGGLFRSSANYLFSGRFSNLLMDVSCAGEGRREAAIEFHGKGPLYLIDGYYPNDIALNDTTVFALGVRFGPGAGYRAIDKRLGVIQELTQSWSKTIALTPGQTQAKIKLEGMETQATDRYAVLATPGFDAGSYWIDDKRTDGFTIHFTKPAPDHSHFDFQLQSTYYALP
jgi:hypothetical protein